MNFKAKFTETQLQNLSSLVGYPIEAVSLFEEAFLHPSCTYLLAKNTPRNYQRLEFLGDRILGLIVAELLIKKFPDEMEGKIARRFTSLVCKDLLAEIARKLHLGQFLIVLPGSEEQLRNSASSLADVVESLVAALYLDKGLEKVRAFILEHWSFYIEEHSKPPKDPKSSLQEWLQAQGMPLPSYELVATKGPLHNPIFVVEVKGEGFESRQGEGNSKKVAEHKAALAVLNEIEKKH